MATISVLGPRAAIDVPLAALLSRAIGTADPDAAAVAAIVLTIGAINAYISGAAAIAGQLAALPGAVAVTVMLGFCGWALAIPAAIALAAGWRPGAAARCKRSSARPACPERCPGTLRERRLMASR